MTHDLGHVISKCTPARCGIHGNEKAAELPKAGGNLGNPICSRALTWQKHS